jgi:hypothetical protein
MTDRALVATGKTSLATACALWFLWVLASTLGWAVGFPIADAILGALGEVVADEVVIYTLLGAVPGILQWPLLRLYLPQAGWWVLASTLAGAFIGAVASTVRVVDPPVGFVVAGASFGILQWLVLRRHIALAGWWLLASSAGWAVGYLVGRAADAVVSALPISETMGLALLFGVFGAVSGAVTGTVLAWLIRKPIPEATRMASSLQH